MKIYLAGGFTVTNVLGREKELADKFIIWKRLLSYYFFSIDKNYGREILSIKKEMMGQKK